MNVESNRYLKPKGADISDFWAGYKNSKKQKKNEFTK